jgi:RNA polymerase-interacting CarD/CdnL/TRCF family regulator
LLFPVAASKGMRPVASEAQAVYVKALLARLATPELADWAERAAPIAALFEALQAQQAARVDLYAAEAQANASRQIALDEARQAYNVAYSRLRVEFPKDKALVESFFADL